MCEGCKCSCGANYRCPARTPAADTEVCTTCPDGHRGDGLTCTLCTSGTFSTVPVSGSCCPEFSSSPSGSAAITACQCNAGYTGENGGTCAKCSPGTYKAGLGPAACTACLSGYDSFVGSISKDDCFQCEVGFYSLGAGQGCLACPPGTYKDFLALIPQRLAQIQTCVKHAHHNRMLQRPVLNGQPASAMRVTQEPTVVLRVMYGW